MALADGKLLIGDHRQIKRLNLRQAGRNNHPRAGRMLSRPVRSDQKLLEPGVARLYTWLGFPGYLRNVSVRGAHGLAHHRHAGLSSLGLDGGDHLLAHSHRHDDLLLALPTNGYAQMRRFFR